MAKSIVATIKKKPKRLEVPAEGGQLLWERRGRRNHHRVVPQTNAIQKKGKKAIAARTPKKAKKKMFRGGEEEKKKKKSSMGGGGWRPGLFVTTGQKTEGYLKKVGKRLGGGNMDTRPNARCPQPTRQPRAWKKREKSLFATRLRDKVRW